MKTYEFITIEQIDSETYNNKPLYTIYNNKTKYPVGIIYYYKSYDKYVFESQDGKIFANTCLKDIVDFLENEIE